MIPIGAFSVTTVQDTVWKVVQCECCTTIYAYRLEVTASGIGGGPYPLGFFAEDHATDAAYVRFEQKVRRAAPPVPCPACGFYQADMVRKMRRKVHWTHILGTVSLAVAGSLALLGESGEWRIALGFAFSGIGLFVAGYNFTQQFDPNVGDPEPRKQLGQSLAIWGENLQRLLQGDQTAHEEA